MKKIERMMEDLLENLHAAGSYHSKRRVVNIEHNKDFTEKMERSRTEFWQSQPFSTRDLTANDFLPYIFLQINKSMHYKSDKLKGDRSSSNWNVEWK